MPGLMALRAQHGATPNHGRPSPILCLRVKSRH
jgi:hypothetical protein